MIDPEKGEAPVSRSDSWLSVAFNVFLAIACFTLAGLARDWSACLAGLAFIAFIPSRYYSPTPYSQPFWRGVEQSARSSLTMPKWARVCRWLGIALIAALFVGRWAG